MNNETLRLIIKAKDEASAVLRKFGGGLEGVGGRFGRLKKVGSFALGKIVKLAKWAGAAIVAALGVALVKGAKRLMAIENAEAKLRGLGHTAKDVETIMGGALKAVKGTAFGLDEAANIAASAVAAGVKPGRELERILRLTADAATIAQIPLNEMGDIWNKVAAGGRLYMREVNQLQARGVPILAMLSESLGVSQGEVRELVSAGKIGFKDFADAMEKGVGGSALEAGKTTSGAYKNMMAAVSRFGASLLKGVFPLAKEVFGGMTTLLDDLGEKVGPVAESVSGELAKAFHSPRLRGALKATGSAIGDVFRFLADHADDFKRAFGAVAGVVGRVAAFLRETFGPAVAEVAATVRVWLDKLAEFWEKHGETIMRVLSVAFDTIIEVVKGALEIIAGIIQTVAAVLRGDWSAAWEGIKKIAKGAWRALVAILKGLGKAIVAVLALAWGLVKKAAKAAFDAVVDRIRTAGSKVKGAMKTIKDAVGGAWNWVRDKTVGAWQGILGKIETFVNRLIKILNYLPGVNISLIKLTGGKQSIPGYAQGVARVDRPTLAMIGEDGPEAVLPLSKPDRMAAILAEIGIPGFAGGGIIGKIKGGMSSLWGGVSGIWDRLSGLLGGLSLPALTAPFDKLLPNIMERVWAAVKQNFSGGKIIEIAKRFLGVPYVWGGTSPRGFDCSGLAQYVYRQAGINIQRVATAQAWSSGGRWTTKPRPGDLAFFHSASDPAKFMHHVGIYAGGGRMIHAPHTGDVVRYGGLHSDLYGFKSWMGHGGNFIATRPTLFGAGERGAELVSVTPLSGRSDATGGVHIHSGAVVVNVAGSGLSEGQLEGAVRRGVTPALERLAREVRLKRRD